MANCGGCSKQYQLFRIVASGTKFDPGILECKAARKVKDDLVNTNCMAVRLSGGAIPILRALFTLAV